MDNLEGPLAGEDIPLPQDDSDHFTLTTMDQLLVERLAPSEEDDVWLKSWQPKDPDEHAAKEAVLGRLEITRNLLTTLLCDNNELRRQIQELQASMWQTQILM